MASYVATSKTENLSGGALTLTLPTVSNGDMLIALVSGYDGVDVSTPSCTTPSGWTKLDDIHGANNAHLYTAVFTKIWSTGDPTTASWTVSSTGGTDAAHVICASFSGPGPIADLNCNLLLDNSGTMSIAYQNQTDCSIAVLVGTHLAADASATIPDLMSGFTSINTEQSSGGSYTISSRMQYKVVNGDISSIGTWTEALGEVTSGCSLCVSMISGCWVQFIGV